MLCGAGGGDPQWNPKRCGRLFKLPTWSPASSTCCRAADVSGQGHCYKTLHLRAAAWPRPTSLRRVSRARPRPAGYSNALRGKRWGPPVDPQEEGASEGTPGVGIPEASPRVRPREPIFPHEQEWWAHASPGFTPGLLPCRCALRRQLSGLSAVTPGPPRGEPPGCLCAWVQAPGTHPSARYSSTSPSRLRPRGTPAPRLGRVPAAIQHDQE